MLNHSRVLDYVKQNLGFPFNPLELTDQEILDYIVNYTLREFSHYMPEVRKVNLNVQDPCTKVPLIQNEYYIIEKNNLEILNVVDIYFSKSDFIFMGHPIMGAFSQADLPAFFLATETSMQAKLYSNFDKTWEFVHPNVCRISPIMNSDSECTIEIEVMQSPDFSGIPNEFQYLFEQFALADTMVRLGTIRRRYGGNIRTPFGEIPVDTEILNDGKELKANIIQKLEVGTYTNVVFEKG